MTSPSLFVVTGATGWVGRTALHELQAMLPPNEFQSRVLAFASKPRILSSTAYSKTEECSIQVHALVQMPEMLSGCRDVAFIHAAFLTKDRIGSYGVDAFIHTNQMITETVCKALAGISSCRLILMSSGAASHIKTDIDFNQQLRSDPYGALKLREEQQLPKLAPTQILRLYALTGQFIRDPQSFAVGDFLLKALNHESIHLKTQTPVIRGYGHAGDILRAAWKWCASEDLPSATPIATVSDEMSLLNVAEMISEMFSLPQVQHTIDPQAAASIYSAPIQPFVDWLHAYGISPTNFKDQILDTATGLKRQQTKL